MTFPATGDAVLPKDIFPLVGVLQDPICMHDSHFFNGKSLFLKIFHFLYLCLVLLDLCIQLV